MIYEQLNIRLIGLEERVYRLEHLMRIDLNSDGKEPELQILPYTETQLIKAIQKTPLDKEKMLLALAVLHARGIERADAKQIKQCLLSLGVDATRWHINNKVGGRYYDDGIIDEKVISDRQYLYWVLPEKGEKEILDIFSRLGIS